MKNTVNPDKKRITLISRYLEKIELESNLKNYYKGKTILVTGGAGAIGSNLIIALSQIVDDSGRIIILDNLCAIKTRKEWNVASLPNVMFVRGDVRYDKDLKRVFNEEPNMVFHLAAFFANQNSVDYPETSAEVDVLGTIKLLEYSKFIGVERFIYASSRAIYGPYPDLPLKENFVSMHLSTPYQINKITGEMYCNFFYHHYDLKIVNCRFFNSYGPGEAPGQYRNVIPNFIYWAMKRLPLPITGTGEETRDFTYVLDLVQGLLKAGYYERALGEAFNLASGKEVKIVELANLINEITGNKASIQYKQKRKWDTKPRLLASIERAQDLIGYKPIIDFKKGLLTTIEWFKDNWEKIEESANFPPGMSSAVKDAKSICKA